jgi:hypothetical protein
MKRGGFAKYVHEYNLSKLFESLFCRAGNTCRTSASVQPDSNSK